MKLRATISGLLISILLWQSGLAESVRPLSLLEGQAYFKGISYGPFRDGQEPGGPQPTQAEMLEDLKLLQGRWHALRVYGSDPFARQICELIRTEKLPLKVMVGAWIAGPEAEAANRQQVTQAIAIANDFPDVVCAVSVGNETQVFWSFHPVDRDQLIAYIREVRSKTQVPVTVADDFLFWIDPASGRVADELDFIVTHIYAMWHAQPLDKAIGFTQEKLDEVKQAHPDKLIVVGELGWATAKSASGDQAERLLGAANEAAQADFYRQFCEWIDREQVSTFYFSAFDENWKGGPDPLDAEKHWGLFRTDRTPKPALNSPAVERY